MGVPIEVRSPLISVRQAATDAATDTHRAPAGTLLFVVPTFELRGAGGITFWVVIRGSDDHPMSESAPYPLSNGGSIIPFTLPFLAPGSYRVCLDARDIPVGAPVVERRQVADWPLVITQPKRWTQRAKHAPRASGPIRITRTPTPTGAEDTRGLSRRALYSSRAVALAFLLDTFFTTFVRISSS